MFLVPSDRITILCFQYKRVVGRRLGPYVLSSFIILNTIFMWSMTILFNRGAVLYWGMLCLLWFNVTRFAHILEHSAWIRRLGVRVPFRSRHFLSQQLWHFRKNIGSCIENECCCPRTVKISNVYLTSKISIPPEPVFNNMGQQMSGPDSSNDWSIPHESVHS